MAKHTPQQGTHRDIDLQVVEDLVDFLYHKRCIYSVLLNLKVSKGMKLENIALKLSYYGDITQLVGEQLDKPVHPLVKKCHRYSRRAVLTKVLRYLQQELGVQSLNSDQLDLFLEEQVSSLSNWKVLSHYIIQKLLTDEKVEVEDVLPTPTAILGLPTKIQEELYDASVHLQCRNALLEAALSELGKELGIAQFTAEQMAMLKLTYLVNTQINATVH